MTQQEAGKPTLEEVLGLIDKLSIEDQAKLRAVLLENHEDIRDALLSLSKSGRIWSLEEVERELGLE